MAAVGWHARHRPHRGDDRGRREHRQVHRIRRQPGADRHPQQPRGRRGDRASAAAARHWRHRRHRLHRHGARIQPGSGAAQADRGPGPRPHPSSGVRGDVSRLGSADPKAVGHRPDRGVFHAGACTAAGRGILLHGDPVDSASATGRKAESGGRRGKRGKKGGRGEDVAVAKVHAHPAGEHPMFKAMAAANGKHDDEDTTARSKRRPPRTSPNWSPTPSARRTSKPRTMSSRTKTSTKRDESAEDEVDEDEIDLDADDEDDDIDDDIEVIDGDSEDDADDSRTTPTMTRRTPTMRSTATTRTRTRTSLTTRTRTRTRNLPRWPRSVAVIAAGQRCVPRARRSTTTERGVRLPAVAARAQAVTCGDLTL